MNWNWQRGKSATLDVAGGRHDRGKLRALIDQATGDSVDESDEHAGLLSMIREEVVCPFPARLAGEDVECLRFEWPKNGYGLNAVCKSKSKTHVVDIGALEWVEPRPKGHEWIEAYFAWRDLLGLIDPRLTRSSRARRTAGDRPGSEAGWLSESPVNDSVCGVERELAAQPVVQTVERHPVVFQVFFHAGQVSRRRPCRRRRHRLTC